MPEPHPLGLTTVEALLADVAGHLEWPATSAATSTPATLASGPAPAARRAAWRNSPWRPLALAAAALAVLVAALLAVPGTRKALADLFGISGVTVRQVATTVPVPPPTLPLDLGEATSLDEARDRAPFPVVVPTELGEPDAVHVDGTGNRTVVSLSYAPRPGLPAAPQTDLGLLVTELPGRVEPLLEKLVGSGQVEPVDVAGRTALWVQGPHTLLYLDRDGEVRTNETRLAASTLIVPWYTTTVRLEGAFDQATAIRLAESMEAVTGG